MKLTCTFCDNEYIGTVSKEGTSWRAKCPACGRTFDVRMPEGRIVMAFVDDSDPKLDELHFTDDFTGKDIRTYYAFDTFGAFAKAWEKMVKRPDGMWYWVLYNNRAICSGACDDGDLNEISRPYFEED